MKLIDLHCDTAYRIWSEHTSFSSAKLQIRKDTVEKFEDLIQIFAFWSNYKMTNEEAWSHFLSCYNHFNSLHFPQSMKRLYAIEDLRLIGTELSKISLLKNMGISFAGLFWAEDNLFGSGHNCVLDMGLSDFGKEVVLKCFEHKVVVDVSHASSKSTEQILKLAADYHQPIFASHSNFYAVTHHTRNLQTEHAQEIEKLGGVIGLSFVPSHLGDEKIEGFIRHLEYGLSLNLDDCLCIGSDFDGTDCLPIGISSQSDIFYLYKVLTDRGLPSNKCENLLWGNGNLFLKKHKIGLHTSN